MALVRDRFWDLAYGLLLVIAVIAAVFHAAQERWPQAILATAAAAIGAFLLVSDWRRMPAPAETTATSPPPRPTRAFGPASKVDYEQPRDSSGRYTDWLSLGALSGFVATGIMTGTFLLGYAISAIFADEGEGALTIQQWFASMIDNTLTEVALVNLAIVIGLHLVAGIGWAIVYTGFFEPRLSGTGMQRGIKFSLIPWALSVLVFFPLTGTGILGLDLEAGLLPVLGNLLLHLAYGAALGKVYASNAVWDEPFEELDGKNIEILEVAQTMMAIGLIPGAILGALTGVLASTIVDADVDVLMAGVLGLFVGSAVGVWVGSLAGLSSNDIDQLNSAPPHKE